MSNQDLIDYLNNVIAENNSNILAYQASIDGNNEQITVLTDQNTFFSNKIAQFQQNIVWLTAIIDLIPPDVNS